jgi:hypothetical protein
MKPIKKNRNATALKKNIAGFALHPLLLKHWPRIKKEIFLVVYG